MDPWFALFLWLGIWIVLTEGVLPNLTIAPQPGSPTKAHRASEIPDPTRPSTS